MALNHAELQRAFAQSGRTQSDIAGDAGRNTATVGYMLSGARDTATLCVLDAVACALGVHYSTLTTDDIASVEVAV
jgi:transcriptional regulator with XRE-family HTH domain